MEQGLDSCNKIIRGIDGNPAPFREQQPLHDVVTVGVCQNIQSWEDFLGGTRKVEPFQFFRINADGVALEFAEQPTIQIPALQLLQQVVILARNQQGFGVI